MAMVMFRVLERPMRVLFVIALLVGLALMTLFVLTDLARELLRQPFQAPPDLGRSDDWDVAAVDTPASISAADG